MCIYSEIRFNRNEKKEYVSVENPHIHNLFIHVCFSVFMEQRLMNCLFYFIDLDWNLYHRMPRFIIIMQIT